MNPLSAPRDLSTPPDLAHPAGKMTFKFLKALEEEHGVTGVEIASAIISTYLTTLLTADLDSRNS